MGPQATGGLLSNNQLIFITHNEVIRQRHTLFKYSLYQRITTYDIFFQALLASNFQGQEEKWMWVILFTCPTTPNSASRPWGKSPSSQILSKRYLQATCLGCPPKPKSHKTGSYSYNLCFSRKCCQEQSFISFLLVVPQCTAFHWILGHLGKRPGEKLHIHQQKSTFWLEINVHY